MCDFSFSRKSLWEIRFNSSLTNNDNVSNLGGRSALRKGDPPSVWPSLCELSNSLAFHPQSLASKAAITLGTHHHPLSAQTSFDSSWSQSFSLKDWKGAMKLLRPLAALSEDPGSISSIHVEAHDHLSLLEVSRGWSVSFSNLSTNRFLFT